MVLESQLPHKTVNLLLTMKKSNQSFDGFVREMPVKDPLISTLCEMKALPTLEPLPYAIGAIKWQTSRGGNLQGYLAHKKHQPPQDPTVAQCQGTYEDPKGGGCFL